MAEKTKPGTSAKGCVASNAGGIGVIDRPVVLMIDEIQNLTDRRGGPVTQILEDLHLGAHGAAIVPVLAGLANSEAVIEAAGISRLKTDSVLSPGVLDKAEVAKSVKLFMEAFRVACNCDGRAGPGGEDSWAERIFDWSDGWPMHLHNTLASLAKELTVNEGHLDRVDETAVRREAARRRGEYYGKRATGPLAHCPGLRARVMDAIPDDDGIENVLLVKIIAEKNADGTEREDRLPEGMSPEGMFDEMLRKGLIQSLTDNLQCCPIPSMRNWCVAESGGALHLAAWRGDPEMIVSRARNRDLNGQDTRGRTPLHVAAEEHWPDAVRTLLQLGARANAIDSRKQTPLHMAAAKGISLDIVQMLLDAGAKVDARDKNGRTPFDLAVESGRDETDEARRLLEARMLDAAASGNEPKMSPDRVQDNDDIQPPSSGRWQRRDVDGAPGFDLAGSDSPESPFSTRVLRQDMRVVAQTSDGRDVIALGENADRWSYAITEPGTLDALPVAWGTGHASADDAARAAIGKLNAVLATDVGRTAAAHVEKKQSSDRGTRSRKRGRRNDDPGPSS